MKKLNIKIILSTILLSFINPVLAKDYYMNLELNNVKYKNEIKNPSSQVGPPFWMFELGAGALSNKNLFYADRSSSGEAHVYFNTGQLPFIGNPNGYEPFDLNYSNNKISGFFGVVNYPKGNYYAPNNLARISYSEEKISGKYYLEVYIEGAPHADNICFGSCMNVGYSGNQIYKTIDYSTSELPYYNNVILAGSIIQIWINVDEGKISMMKLGSTVSDYFDGSYILNQ